MRPGPAQQSGGAIPTGIHFTCGSALELSSGEMGELEFTVWGDNTANDTESLVLTVKEGDYIWGSVLVNLNFSQAGP